MKAFDIVCSHPWLITQEGLAGIIEITRLSKEERHDRIEALAAKAGQPLQHTHSVTVRDGVATIPVEGPIFRYANMMTQLSGATSTGDISEDFRSALDNPQVHSILLEIDSPGGEASGISELAAQIFSARGQKPVVAYVANLGASAAYWIASACDEIVAADTAMLGSIGVVSAVDVPKDDGKTIEFVSSQSPKKRLDPTTETGRDYVQGMVDALAQVFVESVAAYRGVTPETVVSDFGRGGVLIGQHAVAAGLADRIGTYEDLHAAMAAQKRPAGQPVRYGASASIPGIPIAGQPATNTSPRSDRMNWKDYILGKAREDNVELDEHELEAALGTSTVLEAVNVSAEPAAHAIGQPAAASSAEVDELKARLEQRDREYAELRAESSRHEEYLAAERHERAQAQAREFAARQVNAHRIAPSAQETLAELFARVTASDAGASFGEGVKTTAALLEDLCASMPDRGVFTAEVVKGEATAALASVSHTEGVDGKLVPASESERDKMLAMTPAGKAALAAKRAGK